jgi:hypothetical protein
MKALCLSPSAGPLWAEIQARVLRFTRNRIPARSKVATRGLACPDRPVQLFIHRYQPGKETGMPAHEDATRLAAVVVNLTGDQGTDALYWSPSGDDKTDRVHLARDQFSMALIASSVVHGVTMADRATERITLNIFV